MQGTRTTPGFLGHPNIFLSESMGNEPAPLLGLSDFAKKRGEHQFAQL
jgi:hypothetical protein